MRELRNLLLMMLFYKKGTENIEEFAILPKSIPLAGGGSTFLGTATGNITSVTTFLGSAGTLKK